MAKIQHDGRGGDLLSAAIAKLEASQVEVGWFPAAKYESGPDAGKPVALVATENEFGSSRCPPRPFMRPTIANQSGTWAKIAEKLSRQILRGEQPPGTLAEMIGARVAGDVRKTITQLTSPPLSEGTIARRRANKSGAKSVKPLIDTGRMLATLTHMVTKK